MVFKKILKWVGVFLMLGIVAMMFHRSVERTVEGSTEEQVAKIHATKLTLDDVMGKNLPPDPGAAADKTVQGVDANTNGIRDDVELAIFKEYPNSAKTRAVLLQYALALQMQMTLPVLNNETFTATVEDKDRALNCVWSISSRADMKKFEAETEKNEEFVTSRQINTEQRRKYYRDLYNYLDSYSSPNEGCDLDLSNFPN